MRRNVFIKSAIVLAVFGFLAAAPDAGAAEGLREKGTLYCPVVVSGPDSDVEEVKWVGPDGSEMPPTVSGYADDRKSGSLPLSYDAREEGLLTPVKRQVDGTCWAYSATSAIETNLIKKKIVADAGSVDLSESFLIWFGQNTKTADKSDPLYGDGTNTEKPWSAGGNYNKVAAALSRGSGMEKESMIPALEYTSLDERLRYVNYYTPRDINVIYEGGKREMPEDKIEDTKQAILDYGSVQASYYSDDSLYYPYNGNEEDYSYYTGASEESTNHAIQIVGWDDEFAAENFSPQHPARKGAWLVRNSWGADEKGFHSYFWMSYDERTINNIASYDMEESGSYDNIYQYDGGLYKAYQQYENGTSNVVGNVYTAGSDETLTAVGYYNSSENVSYKISVYKNVPMEKGKDGTEYYGSPLKGESAGVVANGTMEYAGYHMIPLSQPVELEAGENYAVCIQVFNDNGGSVALSVGGNDDTCISGQTYEIGNQSAYILGQNVALKAFTVNRNGADKAVLSELYGESEKLESTEFEMPFEYERYLAVREEAEEALSGGAGMCEIRNAYAHLLVFGGENSVRIAETDSSPLQIVRTGERLCELAGKINEGAINTSGLTICLANDIDLTGCAFEPIGYCKNSKGSYYSFKGIFDGNGHTVSGISYTGSGEWPFTGLFGIVGGQGVVRNVTVEGNITDGTYAVGGIAGQNEGKIENCISRIAVGNTDTSGCAGGIAGYNCGRIWRCANEGSVSGKDAAGIAGHVSTNNNSASGESVPEKDVIVSECFNRGEIRGSSYSAGLVCFMEAGTLADSYNTGVLSGGTKVGVTVPDTSTARISNCYNASAADYGVSKSNSGSFVNCFYHSGNAGASTQGTGKTESEMKSAGFAGALGDVYAADPGFNNGYPVLKWELLYTVSADSGPGYRIRLDETEYAGYFPNSDVAFTVEVAAGYDASDMAVSVNGTVCQPDQEGTYTIQGIKCNSVITVSGVKKKTFTVILPEDHGYTCVPESGSETVEYDDNFSFQVRLSEGYEKTSGFAVTVNGEVVNERDGVYTVYHVSQDCEIAVAGVQIQRCLVTFGQPEHAAIIVKNGTDAIDGASMVDYGTELVITIDVEEGYQCSSLTVNGNAFSSGQKYTVRGDCEISAVVRPESSTPDNPDNPDNPPDNPDNPPDNPDNPPDNPDGPDNPNDPDQGPDPFVTAIDMSFEEQTDRLAKKINLLKENGVLDESAQYSYSSSEPSYISNRLTLLQRNKTEQTVSVILTVTISKDGESREKQVTVRLLPEAKTEPDDPAQDPTDDPTDDPAGDPTQDPTDDPAGDPAQDPADDPANNPTKDPVKTSPSGGGTETPPAAGQTETSAKTESTVLPEKPKKQKRVKAGNIKGITVRVDTETNGTAAVSLIQKTNKKSIVIAGTVTVKGVDYTVTRIRAGAFKNCKKATKITIPATVKKIDKNAFSGAKKLRTIVCKGKKAVIVKKGAFKGLNTKKIKFKAKSMSKKQLKKMKKNLKRAGFKGTVVS